MYLRHHVIVRHVIVRHIIVIYVFVSSCKCYSRLVNVCHAFVPSRIRYFCHANVFHAHACHAIVGHAIVTSCKCLSCKRDHVNVLHTSASSRVPRWLPFHHLRCTDCIMQMCTGILRRSLCTMWRYKQSTGAVSKSSVCAQLPFQWISSDLISPSHILFQVWYVSLFKSVQLLC